MHCYLRATAHTAAKVQCSTVSRFAHVVDARVGDWYICNLIGDLKCQDQGMRRVLPDVPSRGGGAAGHKTTAAPQLRCHAPTLILHRFDHSAALLQTISIATLPYSQARPYSVRTQRCSGHRSVLARAFIHVR